jgi:hypothetical protein
VAALLGFLTSITVTIPGLESGASYLAQADRIESEEKCTLNNDKQKNDFEPDKKGRPRCGYPD